jgi:cytoskeletal protein CcmA (bactofilin family)
MAVAVRAAVRVTRARMGPSRSSDVGRRKLAAQGDNLCGRCDEGHPANGLLHAPPGRHVASAVVSSDQGEASKLEKFTGDVQGPLEVKTSVQIDGTVFGGAIVTGQFALNGTCDGPLEVLLDGQADVTGIVKGDVHVRGGKLRFRGIIDGRLGVKEGADVLVSVGTILNGRQLREDGSFVPVASKGRFSIPDDATRLRPQTQGNWTPES